jgi:hypothetical protein
VQSSNVTMIFGFHRQPTGAFFVRQSKGTGALA